MDERGQDGPGQDGRATSAGLRVAATVLTAAGAVWWFVGASAGTTPSQAWPWWLGGGVVVLALLVLVRTRLDSQGERELFERNGRTYKMVNLVQGLLIAAVVVVCVLLGAQAWIAPGITFVFAVHFLPLATAFRWDGYRYLAFALAPVAAVGAAAAGTGVDAPTVQRWVMTAVGALLWVAVAGALVRRPADRAVRPGADVPA